MKGVYVAVKEGAPCVQQVGHDICKILDLYCAKTGLSEKQAKELGFEVGITFIEHHDIAGYYTGSGMMSVLLIFDVQTHILLGAEITSPSTSWCKTDRYRGYGYSRPFQNRRSARVGFRICPSFFSRL